MIKSPLSGWIGGKYQLSRQIVDLIPEHQCYCEPFAGAAWVFFRKEPSETEVINDLNREVVGLYRVVQHHLDELVRYFRWVLVSREEFDRWLKTPPETLTDIQRAARFYYIQKSAFGGRATNPTFGYAPSRAPKLNLLRIEQDLSDAHLRLSRAYIENLPYHDVIKRYDRERTFFYIDPPYWDCEDYYGKNMFSKADFSNLADILGAIKGKFLLSLNDTSGVRDTFKAFKIEQVRVRYSCGKSSRPLAKEVLIRNY